MKTAIYFILFFFVQIGTVPSIIKYNKLVKKGDESQTKSYLHKTTTNWAKKMFNYSGATLTLNNIENLPKENVLIISNHQSNFDIPLLMSAIPKPIAFVAKLELKKVPIISGWMKRMGCVFLDRNNLRQSMETLSQVSKKLKDGETYVLFPEGTRSKSNTMNEFKKGSLRIAVKAGVPILPITINGSYKLLEENNRICANNVTLTIHEPIETKNLTKAEEKLLSDKVYNIIKAKLTK